MVKQSCGIDNLPVAELNGEVTIQPIEIALFRRFAPGVGLRRHCL